MTRLDTPICESTEIAGRNDATSVSSRIAGCSTIGCRRATPSGPSGCRRSCGISSARVISPASQDGPVREATDDELERVHSADYLRRVAELESAGGGMLDPDTWVSPGSNLAARLAAGAGIEAVSFVLEAPERRALCLVRRRAPCPAERGHGLLHLRERRVAAAEALARYELNRVLIVDFDVHHGNGTQEIFYASDRVGFLSIHRYPFYPGTGARDETGTGAGLGHIVNIPLPYGTAASEYHAAFRSGLEKLADRIRPELVLISAGFDAHAEDPVGDLGLEIEDFEILTRGDRRGCRNSRRGPDRQPARGGLQRPDPGRLRSPPISVPWRGQTLGSTASRDGRTSVAADSERDDPDGI